MAYCNKEIRKPAAEFEGFQKMHFGARMRVSSAFNTVNDANGAIAAMCAWEHPPGKDTSVPSAVSHRIPILKDACILKIRRNGTKNYYCFDAGTDAMNDF